MAEVMDRAPEQTAAQTAAAPAAAGGGKPKMSKKKKRRIRRIIALVLAAAVVVGVVRFRKKDGGGSTEVIRDTVQYGSITATVDGSGLTKAKNSESISITTAGTVQDVFVTEGQVVTAG
ncbi:MAG: multidrug transporter, partial [Oscillospiraceae bacterium]|nr:multidrug transporter [Oscillospiraceae bacterium]